MTELASVEATTLDGQYLLRVRGEVDLSNATQVTEAIGAVVPEDATVIVVDLSELTYLDSAGISAMFGLADRLKHKRQELHLVVPPHSPIRVVLRLTKLDHVIPVRDSFVTRS